MRAAGPIAAILLIITFVMVMPLAVRAQSPEISKDPRIALVIGNSAYEQTPLATAVNDAGLIAQTLRTAGFDVTGAADLDQESIQQTFKEFLTKIEAAGPHAAVFVYLAGYGLQYAGENYFIPAGAALKHDTDIPLEAVRISDFTHALAHLPSQARIIVLDAARDNPFATSGAPLASGLAPVDAEEGSLYAINAAPGTIAPVDKGPYGAYALALTEMLRYGGVSIEDVFARARLRVNENTHGAFVPWDVSKLTSPLVLLAAMSPEGSASQPLETLAELQSEPIREFSGGYDAYAAAMEIDTLSGYQEFVAAFGDYPIAPRVTALLANRRETLTWSWARRVNTPNAYWSYMRRYPEGPHIADARRILASAGAPPDPPARFEPYDFQGLPEPDEDERAIIEHAPFAAGGPNYAPVPPLSARFLPPLPAEFRHLPTPDETATGFLPVPAAIPLNYARPWPRMGSLSHPVLESHEAQPPAAKDETVDESGGPKENQEEKLNEHPAEEPKHQLSNGGETSGPRGAIRRIGGVY